MTIDERFDRLTERHEALAQSLELLTADVRQLTDRMATLAESTKAVLELSQRLANIVIAHDEKLDDHERRLDGLEGGSH